MVRVPETIKKKRSPPVAGRSAPRRSTGLRIQSNAPVSVTNHKTILGRQQVDLHNFERRRRTSFSETS